LREFSTSFARRPRSKANTAASSGFGEHIIPFADALPSIREKVREHMAVRGLPREKVLATVVHLLESTLIRSAIIVRISSPGRQACDMAREAIQLAIQPVLEDANPKIESPYPRIEFHCTSGFAAPAWALGQLSCVRAGH